MGFGRVLSCRWGGPRSFQVGKGTLIEPVSAMRSTRCLVHNKRWCSGNLIWEKELETQQRTLNSASYRLSFYSARKTERDFASFWACKFLIIYYLFYKKISFGNKAKKELFRKESNVWESSWAGEGHEVGIKDEKRTHRIQELFAWRNERLSIKHDTEVGIPETDKMLLNEQCCQVKETVVWGRQ